MAEDSNDVCEPEAARKEAVLSKLAAAEAARRQERDRRREETTAHSEPRESIAQYLSEFNRQTSALHQDLEGLKAENDSKQVQELLDEMTARAFQIEKGIADASYFLPSYDLKQCTATIAETKQRIEARRAELIPKKKFSFAGKTKVSRVKGAEMSSAAAVANPLDAKPVSAGGTSAVAGASMLAAAVEARGDHHPSSTAADTGSGSVVDAAAGSSLIKPSIPVHGAKHSPSPSPQDIALVNQGHGLMGLRDEVVVLAPSGHDFVLIDLVGCSVYLMGHMPALRMMGLRDTLVVAGPVTGACFVDGAASCRIMLASYQARIHCTSDTDLYLRTRSKPIIEHSSRLRFAPFSLEEARTAQAGQATTSGAAPQPQCATGAAAVDDRQCARVQALLRQHRLGEETEMYKQVEDFGWIKATHSPNWALMMDADRMPPVKVPWEKLDNSRNKSSIHLDGGSDEI